jgi:hypothetical protein
VLEAAERQTELQVAGVGPDAELLMVNQRTVGSVAEAARLLQRARGPALLYLDDRGERLFAIAGSTGP